MLAEMNQTKRYFGARFGYGERISDGVYSIPTYTSKGIAFMRMETKDGEPVGKDNFRLFWDEKLTIPWLTNPRPKGLKETKFATAFRKLEATRD